MFDVALRRTEKGHGLHRGDLLDLYDMLECDEVLPFEVESVNGGVAAGFISLEAAKSLDSCCEHLGDFIVSILGSAEEDSEVCEYEFSGIKIWLSR